MFFQVAQRVALKQGLVQTARRGLVRTCYSQCHGLRSFTASSFSPKESVEQVIQLFQRKGTSDYIGEPVTTEEHSLQAAYLGTKAGFPKEAVIAALLHDVGHLVGLDDPTAGRMGDCGVVDHENLGGDYLRNLGFCDKVSTLVRRHVDAKRYLCCVQPGYHDKLSEASKTTLIHQGGPMTPGEAKTFENDENFKIILAMRHWDEAAKVAGKVVPDLLSYTQMMEDNIAAQQLSTN